MPYDGENVVLEEAATLAAIENNSSSGTTDPTQCRVLDAAEKLFAADGFAATSVREITQGAGCNVSAVNYHFGSKEKLYEAVFERLLNRLRTVRLDAVQQVLEEAAGHEDLSLLLSAFAKAFLAPLMEPGRGPDTIQLMARELTAPRLPRGMIFEHLIGPIQQAMVEAMRRCEPRLGATRALLCLHSFIGQLVHVLQMSRIEQLSGRGAALMPDVQSVLRHVVEFSVAGMRAVSIMPLEKSDA